MEPNVILKYKRPTDSWLCPDCDCENSMDKTNCSMCACERPVYPVLVNAWKESDEKPVTSSRKPTAAAPKKSPSKAKSTASAFYTPTRPSSPVIVPPKKKSGAKALVILLTIILIAAIILTAVFIINRSGDYLPEAVDENEVTYQDAMDEFDDGNYEKAIELFSSLPPDYKDTDEMIKESKYQQALTLMKENDADKLTDAKTIFEDLNGYEDSDYQRKECIYKLAEIALEKEDYEEAKNLFESISGHEDSDDRAKYCEYRYAVKLYNSEEYEKAEGIFRKLGDYEDSEDYLTDCVYARADLYVENYNFVDAMKLIYDHTNSYYDSRFINTQNALKSYNKSRGYYPDAKSLLGEWKSEDGKTLIYEYNDVGEVVWRSTLPYTSGSAYYVENGMHYRSSYSSGNMMWAIQRISSSSIKVFNYYDGKIYLMKK